MQPFLANELKILIAQCLWRENAALRSLSLASRAWQSPAQRFLFQNLDVVIHETRTVARLVLLLQNSPHLATYVSHLRLFGDLTALQTVDVFSVLTLAVAIRDLRSLILDAFIITGPPHWYDATSVLS